MFWTNLVQMGQNVLGRWRVGGGFAGNITFLVKARNLQLECTRVLHDTMFAPVLKYGSETMLYRSRRRDIELGL